MIDWGGVNLPQAAVALLRPRGETDSRSAGCGEQEKHQTHALHRRRVVSKDDYWDRKQEHNWEEMSKMKKKGGGVDKEKMKS